MFTWVRTHATLDDLNMGSSEDAEDEKEVAKRGTPAKRRTNALRKAKKPKDMPQRPLSAYNFFFRDQRKAILEERERAPSKTEYSASLFETLGKAVAERWKKLPPSELEKYQKLAEEDQNRYQVELNEYYKKQKDKQKAAKKKLSAASPTFNPGDNELENDSLATSREDRKPAAFVSSSSPAMSAPSIPVTAAGLADPWATTYPAENRTEGCLRAPNNERDQGLEQQLMANMAALSRRHQPLGFEDERTILQPGMHDAVGRHIQSMILESVLDARLRSADASETLLQALWQNHSRMQEVNNLQQLILRSRGAALGSAQSQLVSFLEDSMPSTLPNFSLHPSMHTQSTQPALSAINLTGDGQLHQLELLRTIMLANHPSNTSVHAPFSPIAPTSSFQLRQHQRESTTTYPLQTQQNPMNSAFRGGLVSRYSMNGGLPTTALAAATLSLHRRADSQADSDERTRMPTDDEADNLNSKHHSE